MVNRVEVWVRVQARVAIWVGDWVRVGVNKVRVRVGVIRVRVVVGVRDGVRVIVRVGVG